MTEFTPASGSADRTDVEGRLHALLQAWDRCDAPGVVMAVRHEGRTLIRRGVGSASVQSRQALTPNARVRVASVTKQFTAFLVLLLAEDGLIDLDQPVRAHLAEMGRGPGGEVSVRQLMHHRSGLRDFVDLASFTSGMNPPPRGAALSLTCGQGRLNFTPGEAMIYCNGGYHLLSLIVERLTGESFDRALFQRVLRPLGMWNTACLRSDRLMTPGLADQHTSKTREGWVRGMDASDEVLGEGGLVSTADDLLLWANALRMRGPVGASETWRTFLEAPSFPSGAPGAYACGVQVRRYRGAETLGHGGNMAGVSSHLLVLPEHGLDVVVLSNGAPGCDPAALAHSAVDIVLGGVLAQAAQLAATADLGELLGQWADDDTGMTYRLFDEQGQLRAAVCGYPAGSRMEPTAHGRLMVKANSFEPLGFDCTLDPVSGGLAVTFGSQRTTCRRVAEREADPADFIARVGGDYHNPDCGCLLSIRRDGDDINAHFTSPLGAVRARLNPIAPGWAHLAPWGADEFIDGAMTIRGASHVAEALEINTLRTRGLRFERVHGGCRK